MSPAYSLKEFYILLNIFIYLKGKIIINLSLNKLIILARSFI